MEFAFNRNSVTLTCTILVDASWCPKTKAGGYGVWATSDIGSKVFGGGFEKRFNSPSSAETAAVANAVYYAYEHKVICDNMTILVQTDCAHAISIYQHKFRPKNKHECMSVDWLDQFALNHNLTINFKHVKGHSTSKETRFYCNNKCDEIAKVHMNRLRSLYYIRKMKKKIGKAIANEESETIEKIVAKEAFYDWWYK